MSLKMGADLFMMSAQTKLIETAVSVATAERLRNAQRIERTDQDAVNLPAGPSLGLPGRVFQRSAKSFQDGLSALSLADDAVNELVSILEQIDDLAALSSENGLTTEQRAGLQLEVSALQSDWNRIIDTTLYNNQQLLSGAGSRLMLQGGVSNPATLTLQIGKDPIAGAANYMAGATILVSRSSSGVQGNAASSAMVAFSNNGMAISGDGRYVAFFSGASNLVSGDANATGDIFINDTLSGVTTRVSTSSSEVEGNNTALPSAILSADGSSVGFTSWASNLVNGDTNGFRDAFVKNTLNGVTSMVGTPNGSTPSASITSEVSAISADGRYVAFRSSQQVTSEDTNSSRDGYIKDTISGATRLITTSSSGTIGNDDSEIRAISADGRYIAFDSLATNLVSADTNGSRDVFVKDTFTGETTRISTNSASAQSSGTSYARGISADGRYVLFESSASDLVSGDTNSQTDLFVKDRSTGVTTRVNTDSNGNQASGGSSSGVAISADGRFVVMNSSATNLVSGDTNGASDGFRKDLLTGQMIALGVSSAGNVVSGGATVSGISADGRFVVLTSDSASLTSNDTNALQDVFMREIATSGIQPLAGMVVSNQVSAEITSTLIERYVQELDEHQAKLSAAQTRVGSSASILEVAAANHRAASLPIANERIASSVAQGVSETIRREASSAILAQANLSPSLVALLLGQD